MAALVHIFNTVSVNGAQDEFVNHKLPTFERFEVAKDPSNPSNAIRVYFLSGGVEFVTQVTYDTNVAQEVTDFNASVANIAAAQV